MSNSKSTKKDDNSGEERPENEQKFTLVKPTEEDEAMKHKMLEIWSQSRAELLTWRPFLGILAMNLDLIPVVDRRCSTASTDGRRIFFNPYFLANLTDNERMAILAHEIWHCGLMHFSREIGRIEEHKFWNYAIDHEVNTLLSDDGFSLPSNCVLYEQYRGLSSEQIFELLVSGKLPLRGEIMDDHMEEGSDPSIDGPSSEKKQSEDSKNSKSKGGDKSSDISDRHGPLTRETEDGIELKDDKNFRPRRSDQVWKDWRAKMMAAAQQCSTRGQNLDNYGKILGEILQSKLPWKEILRQFLTPIFGGARSWLPPNRRYVTQGLYLPSRKQEELLKIVVVIDTSGSTMGDIVDSFMSEVNAIVNTFGGYEMTLMQIDMIVQDVQKYSMEEPFNVKDFTLMGGGGTDFRPAFEHVEEEMYNDVKLLMYLTDGYGAAPEKSPPYPVLWVLCEGGVKPAEWGHELQIPPII